MKNKLTVRQSRFVDNYCDSGNGAEAAKQVNKLLAKKLSESN